MTALEFIDKMMPEHDRTSCDDENTANGFYSRNGESWHGRCTRCMYLEIVRGETRYGDPIPDFEPENLCG